MAAHAWCVRMHDAALTARSVIVVPPTSLDISPAAHVALTCASADCASMLAQMAAGLVAPTSGRVLVGEYDTSVQPAHCKRLAGFVPHDPLPLAQTDPDHFIDYRAALWNLDRHRARAHAQLLLERLGSMHESFAYPIVAALLTFPSVLVLDRPQPQFADAIRRAAGPCALFSTHVDRDASHAFSAILREVP